LGLVVVLLETRDLAEAVLALPFAAPVAEVLVVGEGPRVEVARGAEVLLVARGLGEAQEVAGDAGRDLGGLIDAERLLEMGAGFVGLAEDALDLSLNPHGLGHAAVVADGLSDGVRLAGERVRPVVLAAVPRD